MAPMRSMRLFLPTIVGLARQGAQVRVRPCHGDHHDAYVRGNYAC